MPARKPVALHADFSHRDRYERRLAAEEATTPKGKLPLTPPASIRGDQRAAREWRRVVRLYNGLDTAILSRLDLSMLERYCQICSRLDDVLDLRTKTRAQLGELLTQFDDQSIPIMDKLELLKPIHSMEITLSKLDQNANSIGRLEMQLAQSLYLLPRSRGAVVPSSKVEEPPDELEKLLDGIMPDEI